MQDANASCQYHLRQRVVPSAFPASAVTVDVHYTERKFVSKPRGSAPGLVRMTRFKNITVAPKEGVERI